MSDFLSQVEQELGSAFKSNTLLGRTGAHLCLAPHAKRVRPLLTSYFAQALEIPVEKILPIAVASELIHSASLLHDDVIDNADMRRDKPTVNYQWSNSVAVLSGNYLLSLAFGRLKNYAPAITQEAISVVAQMTEAAILELQMRNSLDYNIEDWRHMSIGKTGSLFAFCGTTVALFKNDPKAQEAFRIAGHHIGQVFQLVDDLHDIEEDMNNHEASYPRLMSIAGHANPLVASKAELRKQAELAINALGPWALTDGGQQISLWLNQLACFDSSF
ncbi:MAG: polyprenyl synthetase family protein [Myxococcaceae bacterium]